MTDNQFEQKEATKYSKKKFFCFRKTVEKNCNFFSAVFGKTVGEKNLPFTLAPSYMYSID